MFVSKMYFVTGNASFIGASHVRNKTVCQDASISLVEERTRKYALSAVSDGHGSKKHFRSELGSKFAIECAKEVAEKISRNYHKILKNLKKYGGYDDNFLNYIATQIIILWNKKCIEHVKNHPYVNDEKYLLLTDEDKASINKDNDYINGDINNLKAYGATFLMYIRFKDFSLVLKLGDGNVLFIKDEKIYEDESIIDNNLKFNLTSSLCSEDALKKFNYKFFDKENTPDAVLISSDGIINSFENEQYFYTYCAKVVDLYLKEDKSYEDKIKELLESLSYITETGSGDDCSIAFVINKDISQFIKEYLAKKEN